MRTIPYENAKKFTSPENHLTAGKSLSELMLVDGIAVAPFEILGESIVPGQTNVPAILQGTFIQATNLDGTNPAALGLFYNPTQPFNFGPTGDNVVLGANYIDGSLEVFDFTGDFQQNNYLIVNVPPAQTYIVGLQYFIKPPMPTAVSDATPVGPEALGNRGYIVVIGSSSPGFLVTATVRQNFVRSLADPTDIISSAAYSVPITNGPFVRSLSALQAQSA